MAQSREEIYKTWLGWTEDRLIRVYDEMGLRASGSYAESLQSYVKMGSFVDELTIKGAPHSLFMQEGRGPTKTKTKGVRPLKDIILDWINVKGIVPSGNISKDLLAYLIARKIHREGIKVPGGGINPGANKYNKGEVISSTFTPVWFNGLYTELGRLYVLNTRTDLITTFKNLD